MQAQQEEPEDLSWTGGVGSPWLFDVVDETKWDRLSDEPHIAGQVPTNCGNSIPADEDSCKGPPSGAKGAPDVETKGLYSTHDLAPCSL